MFRHASVFMLFLAMVVFSPGRAGADDLWDDITANPAAFRVEESQAFIPGDLGRWSFFSFNATGNTLLHYRDWNQLAPEREARGNPAGPAPGAYMYFSDSTSGIPFLPRGFLLHPSAALGSNVTWQGGKGSYTVTYSVFDLTDSDDVCGDGVAWSLSRREQGEARVFLRSGVIGPDDGDTGYLTETLTFTEDSGGTVGIIVESGSAGDSDCDGTYVEMEIRQLGDQIPTLSEWGAVVLTCLLVGGLLYSRRRELI